MGARKLSPEPTGNEDIPEEAALMAAVRRVIDAGQLGRWRQTVGERQEARSAYLAVEKAIERGASQEQVLELLKLRALARAEDELEIRRLFAPDPPVRRRKGALV